MKKTLFLCLLLIGLFSYGQEGIDTTKWEKRIYDGETIYVRKSTPDTDTKTRNKIEKERKEYFLQNPYNIKLNTFGLGIEKKLLKTLTIYAEAGSGFYIYWGSEGSGYGFLPYIKIEPRIYVNLFRREHEGKDVGYYSATFLNGIVQKIFGDSEMASIVYGFGVGAQYKILKHFYYGYNFGAGYTNYNGSYPKSEILPMIKTHIGFVF
ncbi:hypothetical protein [Candidatus Venteria ishoeyi]|uniref:DUF3575 domain-containing protein n=1 Tax=Candidatus Venteria ishoeyi TaxID=1899563 RepID=A0A1H6F7D8_9GAMM|nr:hypothetical protein [Candidatus Venteria ishoeyi]SEH05453.1 Uncharacterised protein [Candidatus Venteria ishoeyi]